MLSWAAKVDTNPIKQLIKTHYPIIGVLIASFLIATSMGTYTNWDAQLEYEASTNILKHGLPLVTSGLLINQPPLGFYTSAAAFQLFGTSYLNGIALTTAFGVATVALVYALGILLYGRRTGLVASALFSLIPWHVYMSRTFLIDNQCLFWSLLFLVFGVLAVRRYSDKLVAAAGVFFALALLSKLFAVFALIPLILIIYFRKKEGVFPHSNRKLILFTLPIIITQAVWYGGFANQNFLGVYFSTDFIHPVYVSNPSLLFQPIILAKATGIFLFAAIALAVVASLAYRSKLKALLRMDLICLSTIAVVLAANMALVLGLHLTVPYVSVFKYTYMALPFFCMFAASIADKATALLAGTNWKNLKTHWIEAVFAAIGFTLLFASMLENVSFLGTWVEYTSFGVDTVTYYPIDNYTQTAFGAVLLPMQYGALALIVVSIILSALIAKKSSRLYS
jgi:4-amino-4-deoxy-L-arabinose transferase-like glycosyltransferase